MCHDLKHIIKYSSRWLWKVHAFSNEVEIWAWQCSIEFKNLLASPWHDCKKALEALQKGTRSLPVVQWNCESNMQTVKRCCLCRRSSLNLGVITRADVEWCRAVCKNARPNENSRTSRDWCIRAIYVIKLHRLRILCHPMRCYVHLRPSIVNSLTFYCRIDMCNNLFFTAAAAVDWLVVYK